MLKFNHNFKTKKTLEPEVFHQYSNYGFTLVFNNELFKNKTVSKKLNDRELFVFQKNLKKFNTGGNTKIKKVAKALHKASNLHKQQAKALDSIKLKGGGAAIKGLNFKGVF